MNKGKRDREPMYAFSCQKIRGDRTSVNLHWKQIVDRLVPLKRVDLNVRIGDGGMNVCTTYIFVIIKDNAKFVVIIWLEVAATTGAVKKNGLWVGLSEGLEGGLEDRAVGHYSTFLFNTAPPKV